MGMWFYIYMLALGIPCPLYFWYRGIRLPKGFYKVISRGKDYTQYNSQGLPVDWWLILINIFNWTSFWLPMHDKSTFSITWQPLASQILSNSICLFPFSAIPWESMIIKSGFFSKIVWRTSSLRKVSVEKYISVPYSFLSKLAVCNSKAIFSRVVRLLISSSLGISFWQSRTIAVILYSGFSGTVV